MRLHELRTLNHLPAKVPTSGETASMRQVDQRRDLLSDFMKQLQELGFTQLGQGAYGLVFTNQQLGYAVKIFNRHDVGYKEFLGLVLHDRGNPYYPAIRGKFKDISDKFSACRMELLQPLPKAYEAVIDRIADFIDGYNLTSADAFIERINGFIRSDFKQLLTDEFLETLFDVCQHGRIHDLGLDLHTGNYMLRGQTLVITDPY